MDFETLRRRNKEILVQHAFNVFLSSYRHRDELKEQWVERLLDGHDVENFISNLKCGHTTVVYSDDDVDSVPTDAIGCIKIIDTDLGFHAGLKRKLKVVIYNFKAESFQTTPEKPLFASYHWYCNDGDCYDYDGVRTPIASSVQVGQDLEMEIKITPPNEPGNYNLMVTMVYEGRYWMEDAGLDVQKIPVVVQDYDGRGLTRHALSVFKQLHAAEMEVMH